MKRIDPQQVRRFMAAHREEMLADLSALVRMPSIRTEQDGTDADACLKQAFLLFQKAGFSGCLYEKDGYALVFDREGAKEEQSIGLFAHTDVVPTGDAWQVTEPFSPFYKDGFLYGRGTRDNKCGVVLSLWLLKFFREAGIQPKHPICVFLGSDEERGMSDLLAYRSAHKPPCLSLVPDGDFPVSIGEKGIAHLFLEAKTPFASGLVIQGGEAFNIALGDVQAAVPYSDALLMTLMSLTAGRSDISLKWKDGQILLRAKGVSAHAASPAGSVNAAYLLCSLLAKCGALPEDDRALLERAAYLLSVTDGSVLGIAEKEGQSAPFSPLTAVNGMAKTVNGHLSLSFDIRYGTGTVGDKMIEIVANEAEKQGFTLQMVERKDGFLLDSDSEAVETILSVYNEMKGEKGASPLLMSGGTYARLLPNAYSIGKTVPYFPGRSALDLPEGHGGSHQPDECLPVDSFLEASALVTLLVSRLDEVLP